MGQNENGYFYIRGKPEYDLSFSCKDREEKSRMMMYIKNCQEDFTKWNGLKD